jgi:iron-sulfur cluster assembly protein
MIRITEQAAHQIRKAAELGEMQGLALRIAAKEDAQGKITYGMGFDEIGADDVHFTSEGIDVVVAPTCKELLGGALLDYVELEPGDFQFIFLNPNDPRYKPPTEMPEAP